MANPVAHNSNRATLHASGYIYYDLDVPGLIDIPDAETSAEWTTSVPITYDGNGKKAVYWAGHLWVLSSVIEEGGTTSYIWNKLPDDVDEVYMRLAVIVGEGENVLQLRKGQLFVYDGNYYIKSSSAPSPAAQTRLARGAELDSLQVLINGKMDRAHLGLNEAEITALPAGQVFTTADGENAGVKVASAGVEGDIRVYSAFASNRRFYIVEDVNWDLWVPIVAQNGHNFWPNTIYKTALSAYILLHTSTGPGNTQEIVWKTLCSEVRELNSLPTGGTVTEYDEGRAYVEFYTGDLVKVNGKTYQCTLNCESLVVPFNYTYTWKEIDYYNKSEVNALIPTVPTNVSAFTNDAGYLTQHQDISGKEDKSNKVTSLSAQSTDTQYPSAKCVYDLVSALSSLSFEVAQTKPTTNIKTDVIYLIPKSTSETNNIYDEWIYINNAWELIGTTEIDISGKEDKSNKVTSLSAQSTDTQYVSAKCVYDLIGNVETLLSQV